MDRTFRSARPAKGRDRVLIPGDIERANEERIREEGISVLPAIQNDLKEIAGHLGIPFENR